MARVSSSEVDSHRKLVDEALAADSITLPDLLSSIDNEILVAQLKLNNEGLS
jgi:hypothetical protein